jgi:glycosyltransferase involved in cell wall biosynthesis
MASNSRNRCIVFLYTELAGYIRSCMEALAQSGVEVHVYAWPVNSEAPFEFEDTTAVHYHSRPRTKEELLMQVQALSPGAIVCSGWLDPHYIYVCSHLRPHCRTVIALDNQWSFHWRVALSALRGRLLYRRIFHRAWVPGAPQAAFAERLGFKPMHILTGFYCADTSLYKPFFGHAPQGHFPKRLVYTGRYVASKGVDLLWEAFARAAPEGWELHCMGTGPLWDARKIHPAIHHHGFVQPQQMATFVSVGGVFVLPSLSEPWGVVVHEYAVSGYPLICSRAVGAASAFLEHGVNGICVRTGDVDALAGAIATMAASSNEAFWSMALQSNRMGLQLTQNDWVSTACELMGSA